MKKPRRSVVDVCGTPMTIMAWKVCGCVAEITFVEVRFRIETEIQIMPGHIKRIGSDGMLVMRDGTRVGIVHMGHEVLPAVEQMNHRDALRSEAPPVDVAAVARDAARRAAAAASPQCERDRARAIEASIKNADNLGDPEKEAFRLRAIDGASYDAIAEALHRTGKTARKYSRAGIKSMLESIADKNPDLSGMLSRPSKREVARQDGEGRGPFASPDRQPKSGDDFYDEIDRRLNR